MSRCTNTTACFHDPACEDRDCPGRPAKVAKVHAPRIPREPVPLRPPPPPMLGLRVLWLYACRWYFETAREQMGPLHPDLPHVIHKLRDIERELNTVNTKATS